MRAGSSAGGGVLRGICSTRASSLRCDGRAGRRRWKRGWRARADAELFLSVVTLGEIERGIETQERKDPAFASALRAWLAETETVFADRIVPFGAAEARVWGRFSARLGHTGADLLIAATAEVHRLTVATLNPRDFKPTGVRMEVPR